MKIMFTLSDAKDNFRALLINSANSSASDKNIQLDVKDAKGMEEEQVAQIKTAVKNGYDVIMCNPVNVDITSELKEAAGDLPIVFINSAPAKDDLEANKNIYVGSEEQEAGTFQATYCLDQLKDKDEINVVLLKGEKKHIATKGRSDAVKRLFAKSGKKVNFVFEDNANWSREEAEEYFKIFLATEQPYDCIICNNDEMALGVINACKKAKIDPAKVPILGVDATSDGCQAVKNGEMAFTVYQSADGQGKAAIDAAVLLAQGKELSSLKEKTVDDVYVWVPFEKVDASNVDEYMK